MVIHSRLNGEESDEWRRSVERKSKSKDLVVLMNERGRKRGREKLGTSSAPLPGKGESVYRSWFQTTTRMMSWVDSLLLFPFCFFLFLSKVSPSGNDETMMVRDCLCQRIEAPLLAPSLFSSRNTSWKRDDDWVNFLTKIFFLFNKWIVFSPQYLRDENEERWREMMKKLNEGRTRCGCVRGAVEELKQHTALSLFPLSLSQKVSLLSLFPSIHTLHTTHTFPASLFPSLTAHTQSTSEQFLYVQQETGSEREREEEREWKVRGRKRRKTGWGGMGLLASQKLKAQRIPQLWPLTTLGLFSLFPLYLLFSLST